MISHDRRFIFVHAGRTGGSSLERLAGMGLTEDGRTRGYGNTDFPEKHCGFQYYRDRYPREFQTYFKFTIVRNPFDRLHSGWIWQTRIVGRLPPQSLRQFIETRPPSHTYAEKFRLDGMSAAEAVARFDYVGRFERLAETYRCLAGKLGIADLEIPHTNRTLKGRYQEDYDRESIALVRDRYGLDLALFGYDFETG